MVHTKTDRLNQASNISSLNQSSTAHYKTLTLYTAMLVTLTMTANELQRSYSCNVTCDAHISLFVFLLIFY